jgi:hypothetical protein
LIGPSWTIVEDIRAASVKTLNPELLRPGSQQESVPGLSVEFDYRLSDGMLENIVVPDARDEKTFRILWAKSGPFFELDDKLVLRPVAGAYHDHTGEACFTADFDSLSLPVGAADLSGRPNRGYTFYEKSVSTLLSPPPDMASPGF